MKTKRFRSKNYVLGDKCARGPQVSVSATEEWKKMVVAAAQERSMSMSAWVREAIHEKMERENGNAA